MRPVATAVTSPKPCGFATCITVESLQLDNLIGMKLDIEGGELACLAGALQTLERSQCPPIAIEIWLHKMTDFLASATWQQLVTMGYTMTSIVGNPTDFMLEVKVNISN